MPSVAVKSTQNTTICQLRNAIKSKERAALKQAKIDSLSENERKKRTQQKIQRDEIRKLRIQNQEEESRAIRSEIIKRKEEEEQKARELNEERKRKLIEELKNDSVCGTEIEQESVGTLMPSKKRRPESKSTDPIRKNGFFDSASRVQIDNVISLAKECTGTKPATPGFVPTYNDVMNNASTRLFYSSSENGAGLVGEGAHPWCKPTDWTEFISKLNKLMHNRRKNKIKYFYGEYNFVIEGKEMLQHLQDVPLIMNVNNKKVDYASIVFRFTRSDNSSDDGDDSGDGDDDEEQEDNECNGGNVSEPEKKSIVTRYRSYKDVCTEMHSIIEAASIGFGTPCYASFAFKSGFKVTRTGKKIPMYGAMYVLKRGEKNLNALVTDRVSDVYIQYGRNNESIEDIIQKGVRGFAKKQVIPILVKEAQAHVLNFDSKPANMMVFVDKTCRLVDFDPVLYAKDATYTTFEGCLLVNLLLLCVHARAWINVYFADAFVSAFRELILELVVHARSNKWIYDAKIAHTKFTQDHVLNEEDAKTKLESVVNSYFVERVEESTYKMKPNFLIGKPMLPQLVKFALTGSATANDEAIRGVFGDM